MHMADCKRQVALSPHPRGLPKDPSQGFARAPEKNTHKANEPPRFPQKEAGAVLYAGGGGKGSSSDLAPACILRKNAQTKSRQCRGKEEESDTACCIGTPEHCGLVRRDLVVCPPFWLLPRIETGDSFLWACCAPLLRPHPQGIVPAWALRGEPFGGYGGCPFRSP